MTDMNDLPPKIYFQFAGMTVMLIFFTTNVS